MGDLISIHPVDAAVIHVSNLEQGIHPGIARSSLTKHHLAHPPIAIVVEGGIAHLGHNHKISRANAEERWRGAMDTRNREGNTINTHGTKKLVRMF
jgi:hypothetical protein